MKKALQLPFPSSVGYCEGPTVKGEDGNTAQEVKTSGVKGHGGGVIWVHELLSSEKHGDVTQRKGMSWQMEL